MACTSCTLLRMKARVIWSESRAGIKPLYPWIYSQGRLTVSLLLTRNSVVFVHGLGGDSFSTWTDKASKSMWPAQFLPKEPRFRNARIMTFGYNSKAFVTPLAEKTTDRIFTFGEELLVTLRNARAEQYQRKRPLILVGHSLGGIEINSVSHWAAVRSDNH